ncbi:MAG TPA: DUF6188 family protein, partial [Aeromicrobium sp.]|nr:DUF6188 family protein [Aeromicrobium sp.]
GAILMLYPDSLTGATVETDGTLELAFASGATITVPPNPHYEAWQVNGPNGYLVVCVPGTTGELSVWTDE